MPVETNIEKLQAKIRTVTSEMDTAAKGHWAGLDFFTEKTTKLAAILGYDLTVKKTEAKNGEYDYGSY